MKQVKVNTIIFNKKTGTIIYNNKKYKFVFDLLRDIRIEERKYIINRIIKDDRFSYRTVRNFIDLIDEMGLRKNE